MSDCDTEILITGEIESQTGIDLLVEAILKDQPTIDWSSSSAISSEAEAIEYLRNTVEAGDDLIFSENNRRGERFPEIEQVCRKLGLAYILTVSVDEEFNTSGHREVYDPAKEKIERYEGLDGGPSTLVKAVSVLELLDKGLVKEAKQFLRLSMDPVRDLPICFSVAPGLLDRSQPRP